MAEVLSRGKESEWKMVRWICSEFVYSGWRLIYANVLIDLEPSGIGTAGAERREEDERESRGHAPSR